MANCPECGAYVDTRRHIYCPTCGANLFRTLTSKFAVKRCPNCAHANEQSARVCKNCGKEI